jgi:hypothetical protein
MELNRSRVGLLLIAIAATGLAGACDELSGPRPPNPPPANATFENSGPDALLAEAMQAVRGTEGSVRVFAVDRWIAPPGWEGGVEKVHEDGSKTVLWLQRPASITMGGSYQIAVELPRNDKDVQMRDQVTFTGQIEKVQISYAAPVPDIKIVIREGNVLTKNGK